MLNPHDLSIDEMKERMGNLLHLQNALMELNHYIETVEDLCVNLSIDGSHHAPIEYGHTESAVNDVLQEIKDRLNELGVTV
jgi:hypothetical protein